ncbi:bifunctional DNA-formamidopyrimidine glycosylase/DNA-(apurinic or apyrimidinic site) lyase [Brevibacterium sp. UMB1308A]|uniref:bifunctional DNA-formamidopyrimidine glycosylase/DNA-(apurinic or apyrimidinic site) lyase n=1 Tax=Brevibacterium sp. UMB1308A TaxID=3050608 RepID=UPI00254A75FC|nr:bifunctional DNA-formamidopyrimidine glycosylase/DNA-(apurinic or apyrimidinic site) lyase [Brevibacterium sp. UMB1308A]MDK8346509.1 bifunctional DNA-formamidopyrimidine glycosylase/DNA-(apurinic or apyrimidinic site) lyase [Brevibacterium sp. UMB1308B]MDK8713672.1 bifunctional DNA-formamidopyrimidine glycosylase/DNA-(apurinic or apyrimidinic site) lyase [Brevibacterium sp. UMB1308A]
MPELPEVESVRRGLSAWLTGATITRAQVLDARILGTTSARNVPAERVVSFERALEGVRIVSVERRGKYMWMPLAGDGLRGDSVAGGSETAEVDEWALAMHLGMSGQARIHEAEDQLHPHTRAVFDVAGPAGVGQLRFVDQRIFGHLGVERLVPGVAGVGATGTAGERRLVAESASGAGLDPFEGGFSVPVVARAFARKNVAMKTALLDQRVVSGVGNIYADEALFEAGVHPAARASRLRISRIERVLEAARDVMARALEVGGTSFDALYVNVNGESGYFERSLQVYGREGQPCVRCSTPITRVVLGGRSTHVCVRCQKPQRLR